MQTSHHAKILPLQTLLWLEQPGQNKLVVAICQKWNKKTITAWQSTWVKQ